MPHRPPSQTIDAPNVDRDVQLSAEFAGPRLSNRWHSHKYFKIDCESHMKVAFQGWKKLSYRGPAGEGSCEFNSRQGQGDPGAG
jgi:hypothetical protein